MSDPFSYVPEHMREGYALWIEHGVYPGSFGTAIIENDLRGACGKADEANKRAIVSTVAWFYNYAPSECWGSPEKAAAWAAARQVGRVA